MKFGVGSVVPEPLRRREGGRVARRRRPRSGGERSGQGALAPAAAAGTVRGAGFKHRRSLPRRARGRRLPL